MFNWIFTRGGAIILMVVSMLNLIGIMSGSLSPIEVVVCVIWNGVVCGLCLLRLRNAPESFNLT